VDDCGLAAALECWAAVPGVKAVPLVLPSGALCARPSGALCAHDLYGSGVGSVLTAAGITLLARSLVHFLSFSGSAGSLACLVLPPSRLPATQARKVGKTAAQQLSASLRGTALVVDQTTLECGGVAQQLDAIELVLSLKSARLALESLSQSRTRVKAVYPRAEQPQLQEQPQQA
jgi:hypothetical protein